MSIFTHILSGRTYMRVFRRILVKILIFLLVIIGAGWGGIVLKESKRANSQYALEQYAGHLIANEMERAYEYLDLNLEDTLSYSEFEKAAEAKKYGLYAGFHLEKQEARLDEKGNEFQDYKITYVNSDDEVQAEELITAKKQKQKKYYFFDQWKILSDHCMVKDFTFSVPAGAEVILDGKKADSAWLTETVETVSKDVYCVPEILPGKIGIKVSHPVMETLETEIDTTKDSVDLCKEMQLSEAGKASALESSVQALKSFYLAVVKGQESESEEEKALEETFALCIKEVKELADQQREVLSAKADVGKIFKSLAVSEYNPRYGEITFQEDGAIQLELSMGYHFRGKFEMAVVNETGEYDENGYAITQEIMQELAESADATVKLTMCWSEGVWKITKIDIPMLLQEEE